MASNWKRTNWSYETGEDSTISVIASVSYGRFILRNSVTREAMTIKYRCAAAGLSKGLPVGYSKSTLENESGGSNVYSLGYFNEDVFPTTGYMAGIGGTFGVFDSETGPPDPKFANGGSLGVVIFEMMPFARFSCWGGFRATTPGIGASLGLAYFSLAD